MNIRLLRRLHKLGLSRKHFRGGKLHRWLGAHFFHIQYWKLDRRNMALAWFIGIFWAASPWLGAHIILAIICALIFRANIPLSVTLVWLSNPLTIFAYYPAAYWLGCRLMSEPANPHLRWKTFLSDYHVFQELIAYIWKPLLLGCTTIGIVFGLIGSLAIYCFWPKKKTPSKTTILS